MTKDKKRKTHTKEYQKKQNQQEINLPNNRSQRFNKSAAPSNKQPKNNSCCYFALGRFVRCSYKHPFLRSAYEQHTNKTRTKPLKKEDKPIKP